MATTVSMPQLGETVTEGTILSWAKGVGDSIAIDEVLVEISTDKVDTEIPSPAAGVLLEILAQEGETVVVGAPICVIGEAEGTVPALTSAAADSSPNLDTSPTEGSSEVQVESKDDRARFLSPIVRRLARQHGIVLAGLVGTGRAGRVTRRDIEAHLAASTGASEPSHSPEPVPSRAATSEPARQPDPTRRKEATASPFSPRTVPQPGESVSDTVETIGRLRTLIAENMHRAKHNAAHAWTSIEVDFDRVERVRSKHKQAFKEQHGFALTYLPFILRASIDALRAFPQVNSSFFLDERRHVKHGDLNIGIAVDLDQAGLIVPVLKRADSYRLAGIASLVNEVATRARDGRLEPDELAGGTFVITNMGPFGTLMTQPIINVPNTAILATDGIKKRPVVVSGADGADHIAIHHVGYLSLSWDHRAFDGSTAGMFLARLKTNIESWDWEQEVR